MSFVSYPHLIFLISGQMFEVTVAHEKFRELNKILFISCLLAVAAAEPLQIQISIKYNFHFSSLHSMVADSSYFC